MALFLCKKILKKNLIENFDLIIDLQSKLRNTFILRQFPHKNFYSSTLNFKFCTKKNQYLHTKYKIQNVITNLEKILGYSIPFYEYKVDLINIKNLSLIIKGYRSIGSGFLKTFLKSIFYYLHYRLFL